MTPKDLLAQRVQKDAHFASEKSPLKPDQAAQFTALTYFDPNPSYRFTVEIAPFPEQKSAPLEMTNGTTGPEAIRFGRASFTVDQTSVGLTFFKLGDSLGAHFKDGTNGAETYPNGRFIPAIPQDDGRFLIDFNLAGNPMCAYTSGWSCPVTPAENILPVAIPAGEKLPIGEWVQPAE